VTCRRTLTNACLTVYKNRHRLHGALMFLPYDPSRDFDRATHQPTLRCVRLLILGVFAASCSSSPPPPAPSPASQVWGEIKPVVSVKELMRDMLDPLADNIFESVKTVVSKAGTVETVPKTDEDWERIRIGAVTLAEGASLLKIPRPFAPAGDENNSTGPDAVELSPAQITAKVEADLVEWNARIEALRNVGLEVLEIVKKRDINELWDAGENLDAACENCHRSYWYPGETPEFYQKLRQRLREHRERLPQSGPRR
jgi:cytochrome c556